MNEEFAPYNPFEFINTSEHMRDLFVLLAEDHDPELLAIALGHAIDWFGAEEVAARAGVEVEALDTALATPEFATLYRLLLAFAREEAMV